MTIKASSSSTSTFFFTDRGKKQNKNNRFKSKDRREVKEFNGLEAMSCKLASEARTKTEKSNLLFRRGN
jgi:hypothetical protein